MQQKAIGFDWQLRVSKRAKHPRMTIDNFGKVVLVWPQRMPRRHAPAMVEAHQSWVLKHLAQRPEPTPVLPPTHIPFLAVDKVYAVNYHNTERKGITLTEQADVLHIEGRMDDLARLQDKLRHWVRQQARIHLAPMLDDMAQAMGLRYQKLSIRLQRTRWGSCSAKGHISLNAALLFLPEDLVRHVLRHELVHLRHLNHSSAFWQTVAQWEPDFQQQRRKLKSCGKQVPQWLTQAFTHMEASNGKP